jgi:molecular chaperone GrpE
MTETTRQTEAFETPETPEAEAPEVIGAAEPAAPAGAQPSGQPSSQPSDQPAPDETEEVSQAGPELRLAELETEVAEHKDKLLRALADIENMQRRHARELEEARKYAATGFARELLDVADNLSRALASAPDGEQESEVVQKLIEGVAMTERTLLAAFERHKIVKFVPDAGERFDHNRHQAMFEVPTAAQPPGTVAEVMQPGYTIADRLLRPALVGVAKTPAKPELVRDEEDAGPRRGEQVDTKV